MRSVFPSIAVAAIVASVSAAEAAPKLLGSYTIAGTQMCQAPVGKSGGDIEHQMGTVTFTAVAGSTSKFDFRMSIKDQWGSSVSNTGSIGVNSMTVTGTATISGTANPYSITLVMKVGTSTMTTTGFAQLDLTGATDGIARRAVILSRSNNGEMSGYNCTNEMTYFRQ